MLQDRNDLAALWFPLLFVGTNLAYLALAVPFGRVADRLGRARVMVVGHVFLVGAYLCASGPAGSLVVGAGCLLLLGAFYASTDGVLAAAAASVVPARGARQRDRHRPVGRGAHPARGRGASSAGPGPSSGRVGPPLLMAAACWPCAGGLAGCCARPWQRPALDQGPRRPEQAGQRHHEPALPHSVAFAVVVRPGGAPGSWATRS